MKIGIGRLTALSVAFSVSVAVASQGSALDCFAVAQKTPQIGNEAARLLFNEIVGPAEPVVELDLAELLVRRAAEADRLGLIKEEQKRMRERLRSHVREPVSLKVPRAATKTTWSFELLRKEDLLQLSEAAAEAISTQSRTYAFFDATDIKQSQWAIGLQKTQQGSPLRLVAVAGDRAAFEKRTGLRLYADQGGVLVRRFAVRAVPALVRITAFQGVGTTVPEEEL